MHGLHEGGITHEGLKGGRLIGLEEVVEVIRVDIAIGEWLPGHGVRQVAPAPLKRVQRRAIRRHEEPPYVVRQGAPRGWMGPTVGPQEEMQAVGAGLREGLAEALEPLGVQRGPRQKEPVPWGGCPGAIDIAPREGLLD